MFARIRYIYTHKVALAEVEEQRQASEAAQELVSTMQVEIAALYKKVEQQQSEAAKALEEELRLQQQEAESKLEAAWKFSKLQGKGAEALEKEVAGLREELQTLREKASGAENGAKVQERAQKELEAEVARLHEELELAKTALEEPGLKTGSLVIVNGLKNEALNGKVATVVGWNSDSSRCA